MRRKEERKGGSVVGRIKKIGKRKIFFYCLRESGSLNVSKLFNKQVTDDKTIQVKHLSNMITCINIHKYTHMYMRTDDHLKPFSNNPINPFCARLTH